MNNLAQSVTLVLIGGVVLRMSLTDVYLRYVKEGLRPFLIVAGVFLLVIGLATMIRDVRAEKAAAEADEPEHDHAHQGPIVAWLLMLPIFAIFLVAPPALGSYAAGRSGSAQVAEKSSFPPLPGKDPVELPLVDYATRAIWENGESMAGRTVRMSGFLTPRPAGGFYLTRILLSCCAADGRPLKIGIDGNLPPGLKADDWIEVDGHYTNRKDRNAKARETIAFLTVTDHRRISAPENPYQ